MQNDQNKERFQSSRQGTGSSENRGDSRAEQKNETAGLDEQQRSDISNEIGGEAVTDIREMGHLSGRDDASGGSGDLMEDTSSNEETER